MYIRSESKRSRTIKYGLYWGRKDVFYENMYQSQSDYYSSIAVYGFHSKTYLNSKSYVQLNRLMFECVIYIEQKKIY